ncbi:MAG: DUF3017 domain-containing protein [Nocardioidaceae bacterium]
MNNWLKKPSTTGGIVYLIVLALVFIGLVLIVAGAWRTGVTLMGVSFGIAFVMRSVLPDDRAGMLRVRRRYIDITTLVLCSAAFLVLAVIVPSRK